MHNSKENYIHLNDLGFQENYIITESGSVIDLNNGEKVQSDKRDRYYLKQKGQTRGQYESVFQLYKRAFKKSLYIDNNKDLDNEVWRTIPKHKKYKISNYGRVKSYKRNIVIIMKTRKTAKGYYRVDIDNDTYFVHRLMAEAFIPTEDSENKEVHHKDFTKTNILSNLQWLTKKEHAEIHKKHRNNKQ